MVQGLGLHASTVGGMGSIPGQRIKIPQASQHGPPSPNNNKKRTAGKAVWKCEGCGESGKSEGGLETF